MKKLLLVFLLFFSLSGITLATTCNSDNDCSGAAPYCKYDGTCGCGPLPSPLPPEICTDGDDNNISTAPVVETVSDDDVATDDDNNNIVPAPVVETVSGDDASDDVDVASDPVIRMTLNSIDFLDTSFAWSNPSPSCDVQHLPDSDPKLGQYV